MTVSRYNVILSPVFYRVAAMRFCTNVNRKFFFFTHKILTEPNGTSELPESVGGQRAHSMPQPSPYRQQQSMKVT